MCSAQPAGRRQSCTKCLPAVLGTKAAGGVETGRFIKTHFGGGDFQVWLHTGGGALPLADSGAAKIRSPALRDQNALLGSRAKWCFGKVPCNAEWGAAVHHLHRLAVCSSLPRAAPSQPPCRTGPGSHSASQEATKCLAQSPQIFESLTSPTSRHLTQVSPRGRG